MIAHPFLQHVRTAVIVLLTCCGVAAPAQAAGPAMDVQLGFQGTCKVGHWAPVLVQLTAGDEEMRGTLQISAPDGDGMQCLHLAEHDIHVPAGQQRTFRRYVRLGRTRGRLEVEVRRDGAELISQRLALDADRTPLYSTQHWLLVIGGPLPLDPMMQRRREQPRYELHVTTIDQPPQLPDSWIGYEGVDTIVLTTGRQELIDQLSPTQLNALEQWARMGGTLLLSAGANAPDVAGAGGPLERFIPRPVQRTEAIAEAPGLEAIARAEQRLPQFTLAVLEEPTGEIVSYVEERSRGERAAIVRSDFSFGQTIVVAFDLESSPWKEWPHTASLLTTLLFGDNPTSNQLSNDQGVRRVRRIGYDEMTGQLRSALDHFPGTEQRPAVSVVTFWTVFPLLLAYLALIGPGDFFFLRRFLRHMEWTWITFPLLIVSTSVCIFLLGQYWRGGQELRINQVDVVDIDPQHGWVRGTTWIDLYSPTSAEYDLTLQAAPAVPGTQPSQHQNQNASQSGDQNQHHGTLLTWHGLPGNGLGGFDTTNVELLPTAPYQLLATQRSHPQTKLENLLVSTSATKGFLGRWWREQTFEPPAELRVDVNGVLHGAARNPLSTPLSDVMVAHGQWVYRLDRSLEPGESMRLDGIARRDLEWRLTRRRVLQSTTSYTSTPWDPQNRDVERIMEIMMFYDAAGGQSYTGLGQRYQPFIDLSEQLRLGRAILVGRSAQPAAHLHQRGTSITDNAERRWTWYRVVLPVERAANLTTTDHESGEGVLH